MDGSCGMSNVFLRLVKGPRGNDFSGKKKIFDRMISFVFSLREGG